MTRCKIKGNGCTPYQDAYGTKYSGEMLNIAETVLFRLPYPDHRRISGKRTLHKGASVWECGIWWCRSEDTGERILLTTEGRVMARTVRRLPAGSGADTTLLRESIGTPWDPMLGMIQQTIGSHRRGCKRPFAFFIDVAPIRRQFDLALPTT